METPHFRNHALPEARKEADMDLSAECGGVGAKTDEERPVFVLLGGARRHGFSGRCNDFQRAHQPSGIFGIDRFRAAGVLFLEEREKFPRR
jgi:hypothetical protein